MSKNIVSYIDESGNFDFSKQGSCFYILSFVFISPSVPTNELFKNVKCKRFHAAPIIRGKDEFENLDIITRKKMFRSMATLAETAPASYKSFIYDKKYFSSKGDLLKKIRKDLYSFLMIRIIISASLIP